MFLSFALDFLILIVFKERAFTLGIDFYVSEDANSDGFMHQ